MNYDIKKANEEDIKFCVEISKSKELEVADGSHITKSYFENFLEDEDLFFVAKNQGEVLGFILAEPLKGELIHISLLAVKEDFKGKGIGTKLVKFLEEECVKRGFKYSLLYAPLFNEKTLKFYRKQGFTQGKGHAQFFKEL